MVVEVFGGRTDGRVVSGQCVTVVEGRIGDTNRPINARKGEEDDRAEEVVEGEKEGEHKESENY